MDEFEFFFEKPWSDGLPVVPPTEERIARMLSGTERDPGEVVGRVPPAWEEATVRAVAAHAVMAGCKPAYLPVVIAGLEAVLEERVNLNGVQATMHSAAPLLIVNGPYARAIGLHGGTGCFGPGFRANATIGRALRLLLLNLGAGIPGVISMSTFGQPGRYTFCIAENEAESPWEPLSVSKGFGPGENVVTVAMVESPQVLIDDVSREPDRLLRAVADKIATVGSFNLWVATDLVVALAPEHAEICARAGLSRADAVARLAELAVRRLGDVREVGAWRPERVAKWGFDAEAAPDDHPVPAIKDPADVQLICAGGRPGPLTAVMPGWNGASRAASRAFGA